MKWRNFLRQLKNLRQNMPKTDYRWAVYDRQGSMSDLSGYDPWRIYELGGGAISFSDEFIWVRTDKDDGG